MDECVSMSTHMATKRLDADLQGTPTYNELSSNDYRAHVSNSQSSTYCVHHLFLCSLSSTSYGQTPPRDADHAGCKDDCKSTSGGLQFLGEKQDCTAMSIAEDDYVSLSACCAQVI
ncbi:hypothetical protein Tco_0448975 [Tanacetum coccineum]